MTNADIARLRLFNQHIAKPVFKRPAEIVEYLGAVQAQDYAGAKWALGMRLQNSSDAAIEKAMRKGDIIRTHVLRPTWHFVAPADARWMIELSAARIIAACASQYRQLQLDNAIFKRSNDALAKALEGGKLLNRQEMKAALNDAGIATDDIRFIHLLMRAEVDKIICSGGRQGKQFTYALFDDRVPAGKKFDKDEALAELALRYFESRGPATVQDFTWWSGLAAADARKGLEIVKSELKPLKIDGREYWMGADLPDTSARAPLACLLPAFDEFAVAYDDRTAIINPRYLTQALHVIFNPSIIVDSLVVGNWKTIQTKNATEVELYPFGRVSKIHAKAMATAVKKYKRFIGADA